MAQVWAESHARLVRRVPSLDSIRKSVATINSNSLMVCPSGSVKDALTLACSWSSAATGIANAQLI
jgi:hypothetical protein